MYRYDNYTDSFIRIDGEPNTGSTTVRVGVPIKEAVIIEKTELTDECIDKIAEAVVQKLADRKTENSSEFPNNCDDCIWSVCNYNKAFEDEPQRGCDADCNEDCNECAKETELWRAEQTEREGE